jgi:hypothetical protein
MMEANRTTQIIWEHSPPVAEMWGISEEYMGILILSRAGSLCDYDDATKVIRKLFGPKGLNGAMENAFIIVHQVFTEYLMNL